MSGPAISLAPSDAHACDPVTGLPTRPVLLDALGAMLETARRTGSGVALLHVHLVGAGAGPARAGTAPLLRDSADVVRVLLDDRGLAARVSGDAFAVALPGVRHPSVALGTARRLHRALRGLHGSAGRIGVALYPDDALHPEGLLRAAVRATPTTDAVGFARLPARSSSRGPARPATSRRARAWRACSRRWPSPTSSWPTRSAPSRSCSMDFQVR